MAATTINNPQTHSELETQVGLSYVIAAEEMRLKLVDMLDMWSMGVVRLVGDFAGSGTDTIRVTHADGIGWSNRLLSMANETDAPTLATVAAGFSTVTLGQYGLGYNQSFLAKILMTPQATSRLSLEAIADQAPNNWLRTFRYQLCQTGSGMATAVGNTATTLSLDTMIDLATAFNKQDGVSAEDGLAVVLHPTAVEEVKASARNEPAFQNSLEAFSRVQGIKGRIYGDFLGLGMRCMATSDVATSGGAFKGFAFQPGGIGYGVASTSPADLPAGAEPVYVDEFGLVVYKVLNSNGQQVKQANIVSYFGMALADTDVAFQRLINSVSS